MIVRPLLVSVMAVIAAAVIAVPAQAGGWGGGGGGWGGGGSGGGCHHGGGGGITKIININKNWNYNKNINLNKNININKNIVIAKSNSISVAVAGAGAGAGAVVIGGGGSYVENTVESRSNGDIGEVATEETCEMMDATIVKAVHVVCVSSEGREFPASHMLPETWIDSSYEGEVARCIPGARLKVIIGDVIQSDQGMAGAYDHGEVLDCAPGEAVRHFKEGMLKCTPAVPVKDCTERTNLRRYGTGDMFFSYRGRVCGGRVARSRSEISRMALDGGVGPTSY